MWTSEVKSVDVDIGDCLIALVVFRRGTRPEMAEQEKRLRSYII